MKGKIMNTENTTSTPELPPLTPFAAAEEFVKNSNSMQIAEELGKNYETEESLRSELERKDEAIKVLRARWALRDDKIKDFLKVQILNGGADVEELGQLAEDLDIELTKKVTITFNVSVTAEFEIDLNQDAEDISENDFEIRMDYCGSMDTEADFEWNIDNFDMEEEMA